MPFASNSTLHAPVAPAPASVNPGGPAAGAQPRRLRKLVSAKLEKPGGKMWSLGTICLCLYLFVVHSYKLPIATPLILLGLFLVLAHERPLHFPAPMKWYCGYLFWALLSIPASVSFKFSIEAWIEAIKILLIMFFAANVIRTPNQHRIVTLAWLGFFALYPTRGTLFNFATGQGMFGRYGWNFQFSNFNDMAALTLIPLGLCVERLRSADQKWVKLCALAGVFALPFVVLVTQSRGGMIGMAAFFLFLVVRSKYKARMIGAIAGVAVLALLFAPQAVFDRITGMKHLTSVETLKEADTSAEQRWVIWQVAGNIVIDNPIVGVGIGAYHVVHGRYARRSQEFGLARGRRDAHSTYLRVAAENGLIGLGVFLMIFISGFLQLAKTARSLKNSHAPEDKELRDRCQAYQASYIALAICGIFGSLENVIFPFLLIALSTASVRIGTENKSPLVARVRNRFGKPASVALARPS